MSKTDAGYEAEERRTERRATAVAIFCARQIGGTTGLLREELVAASVRDADAILSRLAATEPKP